MTPPFERPRLEALTREQIAPMDAVFTPDCPPAWRDFAHSFYVTLLACPGYSDAQRAELAMKLVRGMANDLGGTQPYIPSGTLSAKKKRVVLVLEQLEKGATYKTAAAMFGITASRARQIEAEFRKKRASLKRQSSLN